MDMYDYIRVERRDAIKAQLEYLRRIAEKAHLEMEEDCLYELDMRLSQLCFENEKWYRKDDLGY